jgi:hypothetical protein
LREGYVRQAISKRVQELAKLDQAASLLVNDTPWCTHSLPKAQEPTDINGLMAKSLLESGEELAARAFELFDVLQDAKPAIHLSMKRPLILTRKLAANSIKPYAPEVFPDREPWICLLRVSSECGRGHHRGCDVRRFPKVNETPKPFIALGSLQSPLVVGVQRVVDAGPQARLLDEPSE